MLVAFFYTHNSVTTEITELIRIPSWEIMWILAAAIFAGAEWLTIADAGRWSGLLKGRLGAYLLLWPGLDFRGFVSTIFPRRCSSNMLISLGNQAKTVLSERIVFNPFGVRFGVRSMNPS
jgi:hypothetical protein